MESNRNPLLAPRVNNAWTDSVNPQVSGINTPSRYGGYAASVRRTDPVYSNRPGNHLYPGAYGYRPDATTNGRYPSGQNGRNGSHGYYRRYYNNFPYGVYYPYLFNNYGYGNYGYGGVADDAGGLSTDHSVADLGAPDFSGTPNNYYSYVAPEPEVSSVTPSAPAASPDQTLPDAPTVGPQNPSPADPSANPAAQGPDSLVEAVQTELARRGYFAGKPDAMYNATTKEAIRRFQTDQRLPATGRVNEATLHALRLD